jgi:hypothetical protein
MKEYKKYLKEISAEIERNFLSGSPAIDIQMILEKGGIDSNLAGYGGREFIEFEYLGKRYEISQVDK